MKKVFITGAKRTAIGTLGGTLKKTSAVKLGVTAAKAAMTQSRINGENIDETIVGNILSAGQGMGPGRQVSIHAGVPEEKPGYTVNMVCGSGMKSVMTGASDIMLGEADAVLAGGIENMTMSPYLLQKGRFGYRLGDGKVVDHLVSDGLTDVFNDYHMGVTAENIAEKYKISRTEQDEFAAESQKRAVRAMEENKFQEEIEPVEIKTRKGTVTFDKDEHPKPKSTVENLAKLRPAFKKDGSVTAGNSSGINDGASMTVIMSEEKMNELGAKPLAEIVAFSQHGVNPAVMGLGPVGAIRKVLKKAELKLTDIELLELNEAFAVQSLGVLMDLEKEHGVSREWLMERTNVNGGAIALGHPIGCTGNRLIVTLLYEMKKRNLKYGLASLCIGGGMGTAVILKNCE